MAAPPIASGTRGALMPLRSSSREVSSHRPTTTATTITPTKTAWTMKSEATTTAPSPTPTPMAAPRSRPARFFCGGGGAVDMGSCGFSSRNRGPPLRRPAPWSRSSRSSASLPASGTSGTMGMGRVCWASCTSCAGPAGAARISGAARWPAPCGTPQEESFIRLRAARLPCASAARPPARRTSRWCRRAPSRRGGPRPRRTPCP